KINDADYFNWIYFPFIISFPDVSFHHPSSVKTLRLIPRLSNGVRNARKSHANLASFCGLPTFYQGDPYQLTTLLFAYLNGECRSQGKFFVPLNHGPNAIPYIKFLLIPHKSHRPFANPYR